MFNKVTGGTLFWCLHSCGAPNKTTHQIICLSTCNNLETAELNFMQIHLLQKLSCHFYCHFNHTILITTLKETHVFLCAS